jgi:hypothetical protein
MEPEGSLPCSREATSSNTCVKYFFAVLPAPSKHVKALFYIKQIELDGPYYLFMLLLGFTRKWDMRGWSTERT